MQARTRCVEFKLLSAHDQGEDEVTSSSSSPPVRRVAALSSLCLCVCNVPDVAAMPVTWRRVGVRLNTAKVKFLPAAVNPDSWSVRSHAVEKKAMIYIHKQTRLLIYITTKPELGENWGHRGTQGQNTSCTQI